MSGPKPLWPTNAIRAKTNDKLWMLGVDTGKAVAYLQQHVQEALAKFTSPTIGSISTVLSGGIEGLIAAATAEIASLVSANPVIATVDGLVDELASLNASGSPATIAATAPVIQGLIDSATASNPVLAQVANLRLTLASLVTSAGPGIGFLAPQQGMVQGLTKSLELFPIRSGHRHRSLLRRDSCGTR